MSDTTRLDEVMQQINALGEFTPEYHDALAYLLTVMARRQWIIADQMRRSRAAQEARAKRRAEKKAAAP